MGLFCFILFLEFWKVKIICFLLKLVSYDGGGEDGNGMEVFWNKIVTQFGVWCSNAVVMAILVVNSLLVAALFTFILFLKQRFIFEFEL